MREPNSEPVISSAPGARQKSTFRSAWAAESSDFFLIIFVIYYLSPVDKKYCKIILNSQIFEIFYSFLNVFLLIDFCWNINSPSWIFY